LIPVNASRGDRSENLVGGGFSMRAMRTETIRTEHSGPPTASDCGGVPEAGLPALAALVEQIDSSHDAGDIDRLLHGVQVALLGPSVPDGEPDPLLPIELALAEVGARSVRTAGAAVIDREAAALLGRLYNILYCHSCLECATSLRASGLPILCALTRPGHPSRLLAQWLALDRWRRSVGCDLSLAPDATNDPACGRMLAIGTSLGIAPANIAPVASPDRRSLRIRIGEAGEPCLVIRGLSAPELGAWRRCVERYRRRVIQAAFLQAGQ
jgi:hypothetical protein